MLLRVTVALQDPDIRGKLENILSCRDVLTQVTPEHMLDWSSLAPFPTDVLVISKELIPDPVESHIQDFVSTANAASIIVITSEEFDEIQHAGLQAAGVTSVLFGGLAVSDIEIAISTILDSKREVLNKLITGRRAAIKPHLSDFISNSQSMQSFLKVVNKIVDSDSTLLITGETGVGKERLARAIHAASRRTDGPFISVNCGAIPENLIESELFGHIKGSFTGAHSSKRGCFELAHNGILFLDEISEMPLSLQVKLLHVLQDLKIRPVGSEKVIPVDTRVIAATNRNLQNEMEEGRFRNDLYYRLSILTLTVPPLRERTEDIPTLVGSFVSELSTRIGSTARDISPEALSALCNYDWPGNVRELINVIERSILLADANTIELTDLPEEISGTPNIHSSNSALPININSYEGDLLNRNLLDLPLREAKEKVIEQYERLYLKEILTNTNGRIGDAAHLAGIAPRSLFTKMRKYGLRKEDFKDSCKRRQAT